MQKEQTVKSRTIESLSLNGSAAFLYLFFIYLTAITLHFFL